VRAGTNAAASEGVVDEKERVMTGPAVLSERSSFGSRRDDESTLDGSARRNDAEPGGEIRSEPCVLAGEEG